MTLKSLLTGLVRKMVSKKIKNHSHGYVNIESNIFIQ
jgi:hypothetical protein